MKNFKVKNINTKLETEFTATISEIGYLEKKETAIAKDGKEYKRTVLDANNNPVLDTSKVFIQTITFNEEKMDLDIEQFYLEKELTAEQIKTMKNKTFKFKNFLENNGYKTVKDILEEVKTEETIFSINKKITAFLDNVIEKEQKDKEGKITYSVVFQIISNNDNKLNIKNIKMKDKRLTPDLVALKDKKVLISDIKIAEFNGNVYFSTETTPKEIK
ncbi:hypothetical protein N5U55_03040 [Aliarcobacter butzleri]|uniref:hypothetical protein n=1 Tax=Aliarcobacter butzleri TaxID=28197 RepID=UPI0021B246B4|nr:hypothetical protein [Aliarcobacter butzleri]MCT7583088.1 hypothetical protein [Aliarcobacter butzleri]